MKQVKLSNKAKDIGITKDTEDMIKDKIRNVQSKQVLKTFKER